MKPEHAIASVQTSKDVLAPKPAVDERSVEFAAELDLSTLLIEAEEGGSGILIYPGGIFFETSAAVVRDLKARASQAGS